MNSQPIEKRISERPTLSVHSIFYTIQGEGPFAGTPAVFIRLAGCNLQCPLCDTEYTKGRKELTPLDIFAMVGWKVPEPGLVVITGGEPFRQDLAFLIMLLVDAGHYVQIETNGTLRPPIVPFNRNTDERTGAYIVCSPKAGKVHKDIEVTACCYKYVLGLDSSPIDGLPIQVLGHSVRDQVARPPACFKGQIYLQPTDYGMPDLNLRSREKVLESCLKHGYILQLQIHKLLGVE